RPPLRPSLFPYTTLFRSRVAVQTPELDIGLSREALSSLYSLFGSTRRILRDAGPDVGCSRESVGGIAIAVLNLGLRPFVSKWHPDRKSTRLNSSHEWISY